MPNTDPVRLGLVGLGRAGWGMHCPELRGREDRFRIVAACDLIPERRQRMADTYGCRAYERVEDLVGDPDVEVVDIATRSKDHFAHASLALMAGKTVFLEKPMCVTYEEARGLQQLASVSAGGLYVRHNRRFEPAFRHIREILASGILGEVFEVKLRRVGYQRRDDWQSLREFGGGQLLNWGPHIVDHALQLLGAPVAEVWSDLRRVAAVGDAEDHLKLLIRGENGRLVDLEISGGAALAEPEYLIWGDRGALRGEGDTLTLRYLDPEVELPPRSPDPGTPREGTFGTPETLPWIEKTVPVQPSDPGDMTSIWDALYRTLREGEPFPIALEEAVEVTRVTSLAKERSGFQD